MIYVGRLVRFVFHGYHSCITAVPQQCAMSSESLPISYSHGPAGPACSTASRTGRTFYLHLTMPPGTVGLTVDEIRAKLYMFSELHPSERPSARGQGGKGGGRASW